VIFWKDLNNLRGEFLIAQKEKDIIQNKKILSFKINNELK